jgi:hypothetical protein
MHVDQMPVYGPTTGNDVVAAHNWPGGARGIRRNFLNIQGTVAVGNGLAVRRPHRIAFAASFGDASADSALQIVDTDEVFAVVFIIRINRQGTPVGRKLGALETDFRKLAELLSRRVVPHQARGSVTRGLKNQFAVLRNGKAGLPEVKEFFDFLLRQRNRRAGGLQSTAIEGLGHDSSVADIDEITGGEKHVPGNVGRN